MNLSLLLGLVVASHASTGLVTFDGHVADGSLAAKLAEGELVEWQMCLNDEGAGISDCLRLVEKGTEGAFVTRRLSAEPCFNDDLDVCHSGYLVQEERTVVLADTSTIGGVSVDVTDTVRVLTAANDTWCARVMLVEAFTATSQVGLGDGSDAWTTSVAFPHGETLGEGALVERLGDLHVTLVRGEFGVGSWLAMSGQGPLTR